MSMSMFSVSPTVERTRTEASSALPQAPVVEQTVRPRAHRSYRPRRMIARLVRRAAGSQLRWARRLDAGC